MMKRIPSRLRWVRRCRTLAALSVAAVVLASPAMAQSQRSSKPAAATLISKALPAGVSFQNASQEQIAEVIARLLITHRSNPDLVLGIVAAAVEMATPNQVVAVAQGVAKAFAEARSLTAEAPKIARIFGEGLAKKEGSPRELGRIMGAATAEIVKALDRSNGTLIAQTVTAALVTHPELDYTAAAYETVMDEIRTIDSDNTLEDQITSEVLKSVSREVAEQIAPELPVTALTENPVQSQNNNFTTPERPVESSSTPL